MLPLLLLEVLVCLLVVLLVTAALGEDDEAPLVAVRVGVVSASVSYPYPYACPCCSYPYGCVELRLSVSTSEPATPLSALKQ